MVRSAPSGDPVPRYCIQSTSFFPVVSVSAASIRGFSSESLRAAKTHGQMHYRIF
jgi:hypothetical protein